MPERRGYRELWQVPVHVRKLANHQTAVVAAETETCRDRALHGHHPRGVRYKIKVTVRVGRVVVDRWGNDTGANSKCDRDKLDRTAGRTEVARHALGT